MVICLRWGADLHMAQQMPLPLTVSCSSKSRLVLPSWFLPFWYWLTRVVRTKSEELYNDCSCSSWCTSCGAISHTTAGLDYQLIIITGNIAHLIAIHRYWTRCWIGWSRWHKITSSVWSSFFVDCSNSNCGNWTCYIWVPTIKLPELCRGHICACPIQDLGLEQ